MRKDQVNCKSGRHSSGWTKALYFVLIAAIFCFLPASVVEAGSVFRVCPTGCAYSTIQAAVDAAAAGGEIDVAGGTYSDMHTRPSPDGYSGGTGNITQIVYIDKNLVIKGGFSPDFSTRDPAVYITKLDAQNLGRGFVIWWDAVVTLDGMQVTRGIPDGLGGLSAYNNAGGGLFAEDANLTLLNMTFFNNYSTYGMNFGGGVYQWWGILTMDNCIIDHNRANTGGGILAMNLDSLHITNSTISNNISAYGGGIRSGGVQELQIENNNILNNNSLSGGGMYISSSPNALLQKNRFESNTLGNHNATSDARYGAALFIEGSTVISRANLFTNNGLNKFQNLYLNEGTIRVYYPVSFISENDVILGSRTSGFTSVGAPTGMVTLKQVTISGSLDNGISVLQNNLSAINTILADNSGYGVLNLGVGAVNLDHTLWNNNASGDQNGPVTHTNDVAGLPLFASDGYHLSIGSAAIDAGGNSGVRTDFDFKPRPQGNGYDIGAAEFKTLIYSLYLPVAKNQ